MKKILISLAASSLCAVGVSYAGSMGPAALNSEWTGFYVGANAGYWWSQQNNVDTDGAPSFASPDLAVLPSVLSNALAAVGTRNLTVNSDGFIGGGQVGYNYQRDKWVLGLDADIDGLTNSNNTTVSHFQVSIPEVGPLNPASTYTGTVTATHDINYLGAVRGRLGWLTTPSLLVYGTGGFAYGGVSFNTAFSAQVAYTSPAFLPIEAQSKINQTQTGWTAGGGCEWLFKPNWSARIEYNYYGLGTVNNKLTLLQVYTRNPITGPMSSATVTSSAPIGIGTVRLGVNYHFL